MSFVAPVVLTACWGFLAGVMLLLHPRGSLSKIRFLLLTAPVLTGLLTSLSKWITKDMADRLGDARHAFEAARDLFDFCNELAVHVMIMVAFSGVMALAWRARDQERREADAQREVMALVRRALEEAMAAMPNH